MNERHEEQSGQPVDGAAETSVTTPVDPMDQTLVAYLDGELSDAETEKVEADLMTDPVMQRRLRELQATWDMLDELPSKEPNEAFLKSTIELAVASSNKKRIKWHRWPIRIGAMALAFGLAAWGAQQITHSRQMAPFERFVADLDFLEYARMYEKIQDFEFLQLLYESNTFSASGELAESDVIDLPNQERFAQLSEFEIREIQNDEKNFRLKPVSTQEELRSIHQQVLAHETPAELLEMLRLYNQWFAKQPGPEKYALKDLAPRERLAKVKELREDEAEKLFGMEGETSLPSEDIRPLFIWCSEFCEARQEEMVQLWINPPDSPNNDADSKKRNPLPRESVQRLRELPPKHLFQLTHAYMREAVINLIDARDIENLRGKLSLAAVANLDSLLDDGDEQSVLAAQRKLVGRWLFSAIQAQREPLVDTEALVRFVDTEMEEEKRIRMSGMSQSEAIRFARNEYLNSQNEKAADGDDWIWPNTRGRGQRGGRKGPGGRGRRRGNRDSND